MQHDSAVLEELSGRNEQVGHVAPVKFAFLFLHLQPLAVVTVRRVQFAECLHRQKEHQLEMRHAPGQRSPFQRGEETLARGVKLGLGRNTGAARIAGALIRFDLHARRHRESTVLSTSQT